MRRGLRRLVGPNSAEGKASRKVLLVPRWIQPCSAEKVLNLICMIHRDCFNRKPADSWPGLVSPESPGQGLVSSSPVLMQPVVRFASWTGISQEKPAGTAVKYRRQSYYHRLGARTVVDLGVCMFHVIGFKSPGAINRHFGLSRLP